jgi:hypothetical protein
MKININDVVIEYQGERRTIGKMLNDLDRGQAAYWFWHTLISKFESLYMDIKRKADYGTLLPDEPIICDGLEGKISQGYYDKARLTNLIKRYDLLLNEEVRFKNNESKDRT